MSIASRTTAGLGLLLGIAGCIASFRPTLPVPDTPALGPLTHRQFQLLANRSVDGDPVRVLDVRLTPPEF